MQLLSSACVLLGVLASCEQAVPSLTVTPDILDVGIVAAGDQIAAKAQVQVASNIKWLEPVATCGCTRVVLHDASGETIKPETWIPAGAYSLQLDVVPRPSVSLAGISSRILLSWQSNARDGGAATLVVRGEARPAFAVSPAARTFAVEPGRPTAFTLRIAALQDVSGDARFQASSSIVTIDRFHEEISEQGFRTWSIHGHVLLERHLLSDSDVTITADGLHPQAPEARLTLRATRPLVLEPAVQPLPLRWSEHDEAFLGELRATTSADLVPSLQVTARNTRRDGSLLTWKATRCADRSVAIELSLKRPNTRKVDSGVLTLGWLDSEQACVPWVTK